jgi:hypothetical protein
MPFDPTGTDWTAPDYAWDQIEFFPANDTAALKLVGISGPRIFSTSFQTYGMFSAKLRVSPVVGVVSAFYVSGRPPPGRLHACVAGSGAAARAAGVAAGTAMLGRVQLAVVPDACCVLAPHQSCVHGCSHP